MNIIQEKLHAGKRIFLFGVVAFDFIGQRTASDCEGEFRYLIRFEKIHDLIVFGFLTGILTRRKVTDYQNQN